MTEDFGPRFDPCGKTWGATILRPTDQDLPGLKMKYLCQALEGRTGRLIEVGSSAGKHLRSLLALGYRFECHGNDIDSVSLKLGHKISPAAFLTVADGHRLPYRDESFDAVLLMDYLEHVEEPELATNEARRILKKGGVLCLFVPCEGNPLSIYALFKRVFGFNVKKPAGGHVQNFTLSDIVELVSEPSNYQIKSIHYSYHLVGSLMDFTLFLFVFLSGSVETLFWHYNKFYHGNRTSKSTAVAMFNAALGCLNRIAFFESWVLRGRRHLACGVHLVVTKPGS